MLHFFFLSKYESYCKSKGIITERDLLENFAEYIDTKIKKWYDNAIAMLRMENSLDWLSFKRDFILQYEGNNKSSISSLKKIKMKDSNILVYIEEFKKVVLEEGFSVRNKEVIQAFIEGCNLDCKIKLTQMQDYSESFNYKEKKLLV